MTEEPESQESDRRPRLKSPLTVDDPPALLPTLNPKKYNKKDEISH